MKTAATIFAAVALFAAGASAQEAQLQNRKALFSYSNADAKRAVLQLGAMRLSPDGNRLLYVRREQAADKPAEFTGPWSGRLCRLVLRDLQSGKEVVVPGAAMTWDDPMILLVSKAPFDREGKRVAVFATADGRGDGIVSGPSENMSAGVVDLASGHLARVGVTGPIVLPMFVGNGKELLVVNWSKDEMKGQVFVLAEPNAQPRALSVGAIPLAVAPGTDLVAFLSIERRNLTPPSPGGYVTSTTTTFLVHDIKADAKVADLTVNPRNSKLDDYTPQWTSDGKHLYYYDLEEQGLSLAHDPRESDGPVVRYKEFTRVWGAKQKGEVAVLDNLIPVGPGPGGSMVLIARDGGKIVVHDATRGATFPLAVAQARPLWAGGGKIIFASATPDPAGKTEVFLADIVLPATPTTASAPASPSAPVAK